MTLQEIRKLATVDLTKESTRLRTEIAELKRHVAMGEVTNVRQVRNKRKELARVLTVLGEQFAKENA